MTKLAMTGLMYVGVCADAYMAGSVVEVVRVALANDGLAE